MRIEPDVCEDKNEIVEFCEKKSVRELELKEYVTPCIIFQTCICSASFGLVEQSSASILTA